MKKIGLYVNKDKDLGLKYTRILIDSINKNGAKAVMEDHVAQDLGIKEQGFDEENIGYNCEIMVCIGGDGTFLKAARNIYERDIPILGINLGNLGFLTEVDKGAIDEAVKLIVSGDYSIEKRMLLRSDIIRNGNTIASDIVLNDVVISRGAISRILHLKTYINNLFVDLFPGDGLIISTPTGSTAYSLSAGGPIVEPDADLIIATPICPHLLYSRSLITTGERVVKVVIHEDFVHDAMVTVDGQNGYEVRGGDNIVTRKSSKHVKMVKLVNRNFFDVLRSKIYDRGEKINKYEV